MFLIPDSAGAPAVAVLEWIRGGGGSAGFVLRSAKDFIGI
jgi:hypothetical protein